MCEVTFTVWTSHFSLPHSPFQLPQGSPLHDPPKSAARLTSLPFRRITLIEASSLAVSGLFQENPDLFKEHLWRFNEWKMPAVFKNNQLNFD